MSDDPTDHVGDDLRPGEFWLQLPVWVVEPAGAGSHGAVTLGASDGTWSLVLFTDEDLAQRFMRDADLPGRTRPVSTPADLRALIQRFEPQCRYVAFDPPPRVGGRARWVIPAHQVLEKLGE